MNVYDDFFKGISAEDWEFFAADFLSSIGFLVEKPPARGADGGKDLIVSDNGQRFIVSCKHFIHSNKSVTPDDEQSISDRVFQHQVDGFIGFYSTIISSGLQDRLDGLKNKNIPYYIYDKDKISNYLPKMNAWILQKYGSPTFGKTFYWNVHLSQYQPLPCVCCGKDSLSDEMIPLSIAGFCLTKDNKLAYIWGCKSCIAYACEGAWLDQLEGLCIDRLILWDRIVQQTALENEIDNDFYKNYSTHHAALMQRLYPSHLGVHPISSFFDW